MGLCARPKIFIMKIMNSSLRLFITVLAFSGITLISCKGKQTDAEIQASINQKIAQNDEMKGLSVSVSNGVVNLSGECPTEECRKDCADAVKKINGVKDVENNIRVPGVTTLGNTAADEALKTSVRDIVSKYNGVEAELKDSVVILRGEIERNDLEALILSINELQLRVENQMVLK